MKKILYIIPVVLLLSLFSCVDTALVDLKRHPSVPACCDYLDSDPDSAGHHAALHIYDSLWLKNRRVLRNSGVDSAAARYFDSLVEYLYANRQYTIRLEIDSIVDVKNLEDYDSIVTTFYELLTNAVDKTLNQHDIAHVKVLINNIPKVDGSQLYGYPEIVQKGLQKAFDRVLSDSTVVVAIDCDATKECPTAKVTYRIVNCELPLGDHQVPLFTKVDSKMSKFAKSAIARYFKQQGIELDNKILNEVFWKIGIQYDVTMTIPGSDEMYTYRFFAPYSGTDNSYNLSDSITAYTFQALSCFYDFENHMDTTRFIQWDEATSAE